MYHFLYRANRDANFRNVRFNFNIPLCQAGLSDPTYLHRPLSLLLPPVGEKGQGITFIVTQLVRLFVFWILSVSCVLKGNMKRKQNEMQMLGHQTSFVETQTNHFYEYFPSCHSKSSQHSQAQFELNHSVHYGLSDGEQ